jgi:hypothetical protein
MSHDQFIPALLLIGFSPFGQNSYCWPKRTRYATDISVADDVNKSHYHHATSIRVNLFAPNTVAVCFGFQAPISIKQTATKYDDLYKHIINYQTMVENTVDNMEGTHRDVT